MPAPEIAYSSVEHIGPLRWDEYANPVDLEFVCEIVRIDGCLVDESTQAVFLDRSSASAVLTALHPAGQSIEPTVHAAAFVDVGVLAPMGGTHDDFGVVFETCAALEVTQRAGLLRGAQVVGRRRPDSATVLDEALSLYGCLAGPALGRATYVEVGTLYVPRFWIRPAGSGQPHVAAPRWAAAGYSRMFLTDIRSRLLSVPAPTPEFVAVDLAGARGVSPAEVDLTCDEHGAVVLPARSALGLADRAATSARLLGLVVVGGASVVDVVFMPDGAWVEEIDPVDGGDGRLATIAALRGMDHATSDAHADGVGFAAHVGSVLDRHVRARVEPPAVYVLTGVWDNADLLDDWLEHLRALGVSGVLAMDYGSTDGSHDILTGSRWSSFVTMIEFPGIAPDHDEIRTAAARAAWPRGWAVFMDPDEFLVTPTGRIDDPMLVGAMLASSAVELARYEFTTVRSDAADLLPDRPTAGDLRLRRVERDMGKVAIDLGSLVMPGGGAAHEAHGAVTVDVGGSDLCLLHAPLRTLDRFEQKVEHAAHTLAHTVHQDPGWAWHWRRWVVIRDEGGLRDEYLSQFVADEEVERMIEDGVLVRDERLADLVAAAKARRTQPS